MDSHTLDLVAAALFGIALLHTFAAKQFEHIAHRYPRHAGLFHLWARWKWSSASGPWCWWP
jgi:hypothetical protein